MTSPPQGFTDTKGAMIDQIANIISDYYDEDANLRWRKCAEHIADSILGVAQAAPACDDEDRMEKISVLISRMQSTLDRFGDTCVYIRRGGLSWGAVALNRRSDDEKHGVFDLQAQHDRDMLERLEQIGRLKKDRDEWRQKVWDAEAKASSVPSTNSGDAAKCECRACRAERGELDPYSVLSSTHQQDAAK